MDRRKEYSRVPLWIRSSPEERPGRPSPYGQKPSWAVPPYERPKKQPRPPRAPKARRRRRQHSRPPRHEVVATERITLRNPAHLADWEQRAEIVEDHAELVQQAQGTDKAPWPIQVWKIGEEYVLARGFASLAAAVDAGLPEVDVVVAARFPHWELLWVDPNSVEGPDPLLSKALEAQRKIRAVGWVFPPLAVTPDSEDHYILGRGKRGAARLWAAQEEKESSVPIIIRPRPSQAMIAGMVQVEVSQVRIVSHRHLRKMNKPLPTRLLNEVASGHLHPIRVRRTIEGEYELVDGLLRLRAAQEVGLRAIQAIVEINVPKE